MQKYQESLQTCYWHSTLIASIFEHQIVTMIMTNGNSYARSTAVSHNLSFYRHVSFFLPSGEITTIFGNIRTITDFNAALKPPRFAGNYEWQTQKKT